MYLIYIDVYEIQTLPKAGYWKLDDGSGTTALDSSGNNHNGTLYGTGLSWVTGHFNGALSFAGGTTNWSYVDADANSGLKTSATSMVFWMKCPVSYQAWAPIVCLVGKSADYDITIDDGGHLQLFRSVRSASTALTNPTTRTVNNNQWHHVAFTLDATGNACKIYIDGTPDVSGAFGYSETVSKIRLGYRTRNTWAWYKGALDDVKSFDKALSPTEITTEYETIP